MPRFLRKPLIVRGKSLHESKEVLRLAGAEIRIPCFERIRPENVQMRKDYLVNYPFIERDYYYDILLSFGDKCECLEPGHVREEIKRRIQSMASLYRE